MHSSGLPPPPVKVRHGEYSMVFSADDDISQPNPYLLNIALEAVREATTISLADISQRLILPPYYPDVWPGEHYKLLAALVKVISPKLVIEIGTGTGLSALALKKYLPENSRLISFDVAPWQQLPSSCLQLSDFSDGRFSQYVADLSLTAEATSFAHDLRSAELIFVDAAKDGVMEKRLLENFQAMNFENPPLFVFDDIRLWNMLAIWRSIRHPKLDLTSFGHWSGTGLVHWA